MLSRYNLFYFIFLFKLARKKRKREKAWWRGKVKGKPETEIFLWTRSCEVLLACLFFIDCKMWRRFFAGNLREKSKKQRSDAKNTTVNLADFYLPDFVSRYLTSKKQELRSCLLLASLDVNYFSLYELFQSCCLFLKVAGVGIVFWKEDHLPHKLLLGAQEMFVHVLAFRFPVSPRTNHVCEWVL